MRHKSWDDSSFHHHDPVAHFDSGDPCPLPYSFRNSVVVAPADDAADHCSHWNRRNHCFHRTLLGPFPWNHNRVALGDVDVDDTEACDDSNDFVMHDRQNLLEREEERLDDDDAPHDVDPHHCHYKDLPSLQNPYDYDLLDYRGWSSDDWMECYWEEVAEVQSSADVAMMKTTVVHPEYHSDPSD